MKTTDISVKELVSYVPDEIIDNIAKEVNVDYQVKYLEGKDVFKLLLFSQLNTKNISLRNAEFISKKRVFQVFTNKEKDYVVPHTTLSDRLSKIKYEFFEKVYLTYLENLQALFTPEQFKDRKIIRYDSTFVGLTSKLLKIGMHTGRKSEYDKPFKNQIKFTIGFDGLFPVKCKIYQQQKDLADDFSFGEIIKESTLSSKDIVTFDRGLKKRATFKEFWDSGVYFVTRINPTNSYKEINHIEFSKNNAQDTEKLTFKKDTVVYLYHGNGNLCQIPIRLIIFTSKETGADIYFITNIYDLKALDISEIYKMRWDIEVFFKFLKQELNFKHFLSRSENGIKVTLYIALTISIMLLIYKKMNKLSGYKIMKLRFYCELEEEIIKMIVIKCGGNPDLIDNLRLNKGFGQ